MVKISYKSVLVSVVFGLLITLGYLANMDFTPYDSGSGTSKCAYSYPEKSGSTLTADCAGLSYGYPQRFVNTQPSMQYEERDGEVDMDSFVISSQADFDILAFATNLVIWSVVSFAVLSVIQILIPKSKKSKKSRK